MQASDPSSEDEPFSRSGLGGSTSPLYSNSIPPPLSPSSSSDSHLSSASEDFQDQKSGLPSIFGGAKARVRKRRRLQSHPSIPTTPAKQQTPDPGQWERHTRGIASKILAKHGFTGRLGKRADGIAAPIQPVFRPEKLGLGAGPFSEKPHALQVEEALETVNRKTLQSKPPRNKQYRPQPHDAFDKVIDMREALPYEQHTVEPLLRSAHHQTAIEKAQVRDRLFAAPEILYNLQMLAGNARAQVTKATRRRDAETLIIQTAEREVENAELEKYKTKHALAYVSELQSMFDRLVGIRKHPDPKELENCVKQLANLQKTASNKSFVSTQIVVAALIEIVSERVEQQMHNCLLQCVEQGRADKKQVRDIYRVFAEVRNALDPVAYTQLCTRAILAPLRTHVSRPTWDVVRGACVGDVLSWMRRILPEALLQIFAEEVLVPRLLSRLQQYHGSSLIQTGTTEVPAHVWIHPWLPATGRRSLVEVIHRVRVTLSKSLQEWKPGGSPESRAELVALVKVWSRVLSHRKLQLALARHITPKLGSRLTMIRGDSDEQAAKCTLEEITAWAEVGSVRLFAKDLTKPFLNGPGALVQKAAFADNNWAKAKEIYLFWTQSLPKRLKEYMQPALAALLFVLHAARVTTDKNTRRRLQRADLSPLLQNVFERPMASEGKGEAKQGEDIGKSRETRKARLVDVVEMVGRREGLAVVGLDEERGMRVFQVGAARVVVDVERNVFVVRGRVVDVDEIVRLAKGG